MPVIKKPRGIDVSEWDAIGMMNPMLTLPGVRRAAYLRPNSYHMQELLNYAKAKEPLLDTVANHPAWTSMGNTMFDVLKQAREIPVIREGINRPESGQPIADMASEWLKKATEGVQEHRKAMPLRPEDLREGYSILIRTMLQ